ncbi:hypothetical protein ACUXDX_002018 [Staphylococcus epidermidis]
MEALSNKATRDKYCSSASLRTASGTSLLLTVTLVVFWFAPFFCGNESA